MKIKFLLLTLAVCTALLVASCGGGTASSDAKAEGPSAKTYKNLPTGAEIEQAYNALIKKTGVAEPELLEIQAYFHKSIISDDKNSASVSINIVDPKNKNNVVEYSYSLASGSMSGPEKVTLSSGVGSNEKFLDKYEDFKEFLFKRSDFPAFSKVDEMVATAIEKSGYGTDCYVTGFTWKSDNINKFSIGVQSTRSVTASKSSYFNKEGNFLK